MSLIAIVRSKCLVITFEGDRLSAANFMSRRKAFLDSIDLDILSMATCWIFAGDLLDRMAHLYPRHLLVYRLGVLIGQSLLIESGTELAMRENEYENRFAWGAEAGFYHFGIRDPVYIPPSQMPAFIQSRVETQLPVELFRTNDEYEEVVPFPPPRQDGVFSTMWKRRSFRGFGSDPISIEQLRDCLFSGLGITGSIATGNEGEGRLPLSMTPSGGARNPYELYVYVRNVCGLKPGIYHYSGVENSVGLVKSPPLPSIPEVLADQPWFGEAAALVMLVANFERTAWKYPHPTGYRVVLLEAGHIAQNILLAATENGIAAAPTCAVSDRLADQILDNKSIMRSLVYTVALGQKSSTPTQADAIGYLPNLMLFGRAKMQSGAANGASPSISLRTMTNNECEAYLKESAPQLAIAEAIAYKVPVEELLDSCRIALRTLLPDDNSNLLDQFLWTILHDEQPVGNAWLGRRHVGATEVAYLYDISIKPEFRGRGLGAAALLAIEAEAIARGFEKLVLNVFAHNSPAEIMYARRGFSKVSTILSKQLNERKPEYVE